MSEFLEMGGYARYVWPSFAITFAIVLWNIVAARRALASARRDALRRIASGGGS